MSVPKPGRNRPGRWRRITAPMAVIGLVLAGSSVAAVGYADTEKTDSSEAIPGVKVVETRVDGREGEILGTDNPRPTFSWRFDAEPVPSDDPCLFDTETPCAGDEQLAYQIRVAENEAQLAAGAFIWDSGRVEGSEQTGIAYEGPEFSSRDTYAWQVRVWDALEQASPWSAPQSVELGLLSEEDWGDAQWIEHHEREVDDPLPMFARSLELDKEVAEARLYVSGIGRFHATVNGETLSEEINPGGDSNYQLSSEYRTYDVTDVVVKGENTVGLEVGHGQAYVRRNLTNPDPFYDREKPYAYWQSHFAAEGELATDAQAGTTSVTLDSVGGHHVGGTINIDTADGGERLESRVITSIDSEQNAISFEPALDRDHEAGSEVIGSGNPNSGSETKFDRGPGGVALTPRVIARIEVTYADGSTEEVVTDRSWRAAKGPLMFDAWYSGADYDARKSQPGWNEPGADLTDSAQRRDGTPTEWIDAGIAPPPNLATELVARNGEYVTVQETFDAVDVTNPEPGVWVFDFGQNSAGIPELHLKDALPEGTTIRMTPGEHLNEDGTVNEDSLRSGDHGQRGWDIFDSYTTAGEAGERWMSKFGYKSGQWVQVDGLPEGYTPPNDLVRMHQVSADVGHPGTVDTSNERMNRLDRMAKYSVLSNTQSVLTDTPGREKASFEADYTQPMGYIHRHIDTRAYLYTTMHHIVESQSVVEETLGNVPITAPNFYLPYVDMFGDEINWGNGIVLVPWYLHELYGDTSLAETYWDEMNIFVDYIRERKDEGRIVEAPLADWLASQDTDEALVGTWGYWVTIDRMAQLAELLGKDDEAAEFEDLREEIRDAFNERFYDAELGRYTSGGPEGATQAAQALALDTGIVEEEHRGEVVSALIELLYEYGPLEEGVEAEDAPHFSAGTMGMQAIIRTLIEERRDDVLWDLLQQDTQPSYGYFLQETANSPHGLTTMPEHWDVPFSGSKTHMILGQIDEWFHAGIAGIRQAPGSHAYREVIIDPRMAGDLTEAQGSYESPAGTISSAWQRTDDSLALQVEIPVNTTGIVRVPTNIVDGEVSASRGAEPSDVAEEYEEYRVSSGTWSFNVGQNALQADAGGPYEVELGDELQLDGRGTEAGSSDDLSYEWDVSEFSEGTITGESPTVKATVEGEHEVHLRVIDGEGFTSTSTSDVIVTAAGDGGEDPEEPDAGGDGGDDTNDPADPDGTDEDGTGGGGSDEADDTGNLPDTGSSGRVIAALAAIATLLTAAGVTVYVRRTRNASMM